MQLKHINRRNRNKVAVWPIITLALVFTILNACVKKLPDEIPSLVTVNLTDITSASFTSGGLIFSAGGDTVIARGICLSTENNPLISDTKTTDGTGTGSFTSSISGLAANTTYYIRAYATNHVGTGYGNLYILTTNDDSITLTTSPVSDVTSTTASSGGNITSDGGTDITARGVCWSTSPVPTISDNITSDGTGNGMFASSVTGLTPGTSYYLRAYATNSSGTFYGNEVTFNTICNLPSAPGEITGNTNVNANATGITYSITTVPDATGYSWTVPPGASISSGQGTTDIIVDFGITGGIVSVRSENTCGNSVNSDLMVSVISISNCGVVTDIDGNVYSTVTIGTQCWMAENLKTTRYQNGDPIINVTDDLAWSTFTSGAYCWYDNDAASYQAIYGALYNWYSVTDSRLLCPAGWHAPSNAEWTILEDFLINNGYNYDGSTVGNKCAKALATATGWNPSANAGAVGNTDYPDKMNSSGFTALPGGVRDANQLIFGSMGNFGMWWTATEDSPSTAWDRGLANYTSSLGRLNVNKSHGFSVRCLKNN